MLATGRTCRPQFASSTLAGFDLTSAPFPGRRWFGSQRARASVVGPPFQARSPLAVAQRLQQRDPETPCGIARSERERADPVHAAREPPREGRVREVGGEGFGQPLDVLAAQQLEPVRTEPGEREGAAPQRPAQRAPERPARKRGVVEQRERVAGASHRGAGDQTEPAGEVARRAQRGREKRATGRAEIRIGSRLPPGARLEPEEKRAQHDPRPHRATLLLWSASA